MGSQFIINDVLDVQKRRDAELSVLDALITQKLINQELARLKIDVTEQDLKNSIADMARNNNITEDVLRKEVAKGGMEWETYRSQLKDSIRQMRFNQNILQARIAVNEDALRDRYNRLQQNTPKEITLGIVFFKQPKQPGQDQLVELQDKITYLKQRVASNEPFINISRELDESGFKGVMGPFKPGNLRSDLNEAAFGTPLKTLSEPVCDANGCFFFYPLSEKRKAGQSFEEMRGKILESYYAERFGIEQQKWAEQVKRRSSIEIKLKKNVQ